LLQRLQLLFFAVVLHLIVVRPFLHALRSDRPLIARDHRATLQFCECFLLLLFTIRSHAEICCSTRLFDASAKNANVCSLAVIKSLDRAGPRLWAADVTGQPFNQIQVDIVTQTDRPTKLYEILLINARVTGIKTSVSFGERLEDLTIVAESISLKFFPDNGQPIIASVSCR
jgi:type VI secretion system (T6SS) effector Hcp